MEVECPGTVKSKARLVKEGSLTMIVYGDDERLVWQKRIAQFRGAVRCACIWHVHISYTEQKPSGRCADGLLQFTDCASEGPALNLNL